MISFLVPPSGYVLASWLFLRLLGVVYVIAFISLARQVRGLIGQQGISPAGAFLASVKELHGRKAYLLVPSLVWLDSRDGFLMGMSITGAVLGVLLALGYQTTPVLVILWALYLSLAGVGQVFLSYQWDALLLEAGFLAVFLAPPSLLLPPVLFSPSPWIVFLFRWLLFRLIWMSGLLKLLSGDPTWRNLTAMCYHYETQPLPNPVAWFMHKASGWIQKLSTLFTLVAEGLVPFLYFVPGPARWLVGGGFTLLLMALIEGTGNFAFFNLLTASLVIFLFDDGLLLPLLPAGIQTQVSQAAGQGWGNWLLIPLSVLIFLLGLLFLASRIFTGLTSQRWVYNLMQVVGSFRLANAYGLFTVMTTVRPEIVMEGSRDASNWLPYEFKYKPGNLFRPPPVIAPFHPRLDWQMWFAALQPSPTAVPWFLPFVVRLLTGSPPVLSLLGKNPFPDQPPTYVRAVLYNYQFSSWQEKAKTGAWWKREELGLFLPPVSISLENREQ